MVDKHTKTPLLYRGGVLWISVLRFDLTNRRCELPVSLCLTGLPENRVPHGESASVPACVLQLVCHALSLGAPSPDVN